MNKTERRKALNRSFYEFINTKFPQYNISDDGNGGFMTLNDTGSKSYDDVIEYHRSQHYVIHLNGASEQVKADAEEMEIHIGKLKRQYDLL